MSYSNLEILSGILVAACLLLLYCNYSKSNSENMLHGRILPGLHMRQGMEGMYGDLPRAGTFKARDGYVVGHPHDASLSYTTRSSHFQENMNSGLNDRSIPPTPASAATPEPNGSGNNILWMPDAEIPLNVYVGGGLNSQQFSEEDEKYIMNNVFNRKINQNSVQGPSSVGGVSLKYIDYGGNMQPTRQITM